MQPASQQQRWRSNGEMKVSRGFSLKQHRVCFSEAGRIHFTWSRTSLSNFHSMTFVYFSLKFSSFLHLVLLLPPQWQLLFCVHSLSHSVLKSAIISFTCPDHEQSRGPGFRGSFCWSCSESFPCPSPRMPTNEKFYHHVTAETTLRGVRLLWTLVVLGAQWTGPLHFDNEEAKSHSVHDP